MQVENGTGQGREGVASDVEGVEATKEPDCEREARETVVLQRETLEIAQSPDRGVESAEVNMIQRERGEAFGFTKLEDKRERRNRNGVTLLCSGCSRTSDKGPSQ